MQVHIYIYINTSACMYTCVYIYISVQIYACVCTHVQGFIWNYIIQFQVCILGYKSWEYTGACRNMDPKTAPCSYSGGSMQKLRSFRSLVPLNLKLMA